MFVGVYGRADIPHKSPYLFLVIFYQHNENRLLPDGILELCEKRNMAVNALATASGVSPSTIYSMLNEKSKNPGVVSLKKLCDGLEISIREFFNSELFDELEQEIK